jgi:hypothetical protein
MRGSGNIKAMAFIGLKSAVAAALLGWLIGSWFRHTDQPRCGTIT